MSSFQEKKAIAYQTVRLIFLTEEIKYWVRHEYEYDSTQDFKTQFFESKPYAMMVVLANTEDELDIMVNEIEQRYK
jgi:hypothetical protein